MKMDLILNNVNLLVSKLDKKVCWLVLTYISDLTDLLWPGLSIKAIYIVHQDLIGL